MQAFCGIGSRKCADVCIMARGTGLLVFLPLLVPMHTWCFTATVSILEPLFVISASARMHDRRGVVLVHLVIMRRVKHTEGTGNQNIEKSCRG